MCYLVKELMCLPSYIKKNLVSIILIAVTVIVLLSMLIMYADSREKEMDTFLKVELQHNHGVNTANIVSIKGIVECPLQEKGQSYFENKDYVYTYGSTGFVFVKLKTGDIYVVLRDDLDSTRREQLIHDLTKERYNVIPYTPKVVFLAASQLDKNTYTIMKILEKEQVQYPTELQKPIDLKRDYSDSAFEKKENSEKKQTSVIGEI